MNSTIDLGNDTNPSEEPQVAAPVVRVTQLAGDTVTLDHTETLTVREYLEQAGVTLGRGEVVTVNGALADLDSTVEPDSVVVVAGKVTNG